MHTSDWLARAYDCAHRPSYFFTKNYHLAIYFEEAHSFMKQPFCCMEIHLAIHLFLFFINGDTATNSSEISSNIPVDSTERFPCTLALSFQSQKVLQFSMIASCQTFTTRLLIELIKESFCFSVRAEIIFCARIRPVLSVCHYFVERVSKVFLFFSVQ